MRTKSLILIFIALGCGLVASIGISQVMESRGGQSPTVEMSPILVALADIDIGPRIGTTLQLRYEWLCRMQINQSVLYYGKPTNYFPEATGYRKVFLTPQVSYTKGLFSAYVSADIPLYQYLHSTDLYTQAGSQYQVTAGVSFRIKTGRDPAKVVESGMYYCPMHPEVTNVLPSTCPICGMALEKKQ